MPIDVLKLIAFIMADLPDVEALISAVSKLVVAEQNAKSFQERQKLSEPVQEALAVLIDKVKAQVEAFQASQG